MRFWILLAFVPLLVIGCSGVSLTRNKLTKMRQIRGYLPGATVETYLVRDKWTQPPNTFWISWADESNNLRSMDELNLPEEVWNRYEIGDPIKLVFVPNDDSPFHRDGIFASDENFLFDYGLLCVECAMIAAAIVGAPVTFVVLLIFFKPAPTGKKRRS